MSGIIARATIVSSVFESSGHEEGLRFWHNSHPQPGRKLVKLTVDRVARPDEVISHHTLADDPICHDLLILRQRTGTNWILSEAHTARLDRLWAEYGARQISADEPSAPWAHPHGSGELIPGESHIAPPPPPPEGLPGRASTTVSRVIRDSERSRWVKDVHDHAWQVCGTQLVGPRGFYAEGAHIRPLGADHEGVDSEHNLLCLCPNHHALLDLGAFTISDNYDLIDLAGNGVRGRLRTAAQHTIDQPHLRYHRVNVAGQAE